MCGSEAVAFISSGLRATRIWEWLSWTDGRIYGLQDVASALAACQRAKALEQRMEQREQSWLTIATGVDFLKMATPRISTLPTSTDH